MSEPTFDPSSFYEFSLAEGLVRSKANRRVIVWPEDAMRELAKLASKSGDLTAFRTLGTLIGQAAKDSLGTAPNNASPETVLNHLVGTLALFGFGRITLERWGRALVIRTESAPQLDEHNTAYASLLGSAFSVLSGNPVGCVPLRDQQFLIVSPATAERLSKDTTVHNADVLTILSRLEAVS